jgi:hypothetical protein
LDVWLRQPVYAAVRGLWLPYHDQLVHARLGSPDLTGPPEELANAGPRTWERKDVKNLPRRIKTHECIRAEVAQPDEIIVVHVDGVRL